MLNMRFVFQDFARFVFALLVALVHFSGGGFPVKAYLAVDFFFVLSGFVLTHAYCSKINQSGFMCNFVIDRIARLYPLFIATTILLLLMNVYVFYQTGSYLEQGWSYKDGYLYTFLLNILLMQNIGLTTGSSWNAPGWSISVEFFGSFILAFILQWWAAKGQKVIWIALLGSLLGYVLIFNKLHFLGDFQTNLFGLLNSGLLRGCAGLLLGFVSYYSYGVILKISTKWNLTWFYCAVALATLSMLLGFVFLGDKVQNADFASVPVIFLFVVSLALFEESIVRFSIYMPSVLISSLQTAGALSYAIYLIHWPMLSFCRYILFYTHKINLNFNSLSFGAVFFSVLIVLSWVVHFKFELPMKSAVKGLWKRVNDV